MRWVWLQELKWAELTKVAILGSNADGTLTYVRLKYKNIENHFKWLETLKWGRKRLNVSHHLQGREHHLILANDCLLQ